MSTKLQTVIKYCVVLIVIVHWTACALKLVTEYTLNECDYEDCPQTILTSTSNYRDGIWAQYVEAAVWALVAINGEASTRTHGEGVLGLLVMLCVEIKITRRVRRDACSTAWRCWSFTARFSQHAPDAPVDFHTELYPGPRGPSLPVL